MLSAILTIMMHLSHHQVTGLVQCRASACSCFTTWSQSDMKISENISLFEKHMQNYIELLPFMWDHNYSTNKLSHSMRTYGKHQRTYDRLRETVFCTSTKCKLQIHFCLVVEFYTWWKDHVPACTLVPSSHPCTHLLQFLFLLRCQIVFTSTAGRKRWSFRPRPGSPCVTLEP